MEPEQTITIIGGTGHIGRVFINTFRESGLHVRILARDPDKAHAAYPECEIIPGSMLEVLNVERSLAGAQACLLITPIGGNHDMTIELNSARAVITAARRTRLPHLIFSSVLQGENPTGIPLLDSKRLIEAYIAESGIPWSSLRAGFYMEDVLDLAPWTLKAGWFFFPLSNRHQYSFTSRMDHARLTADLVKNHVVLGSAVDVVEAHPRSMGDIASMYSNLLGRVIRPCGDQPWLSLLRAALPIQYRVNPVMVSKTGMLEFFNRTDFIGDPALLLSLFPDFQISSMEEYVTSVQVTI